MKKMRSKKIGTSNKNQATQINIRLSLEEKESLEQKARERGATMTAYIKEKSLQEIDSNIHNKETEKAIYKVTDILINEVPKYCMDETFVKECREGVKELWQFLR